jgi:hypothetical protein
VTGRRPLPRRPGHPVGGVRADELGHALDAATALGWLSALEAVTGAPDAAEHPDHDHGDARAAGYVARRDAGERPPSRGEDVLVAVGRGGQWVAWRVAVDLHRAGPDVAWVCVDTVFMCGCRAYGPPINCS